MVTQNYVYINVGMYTYTFKNIMAVIMLISKNKYIFTNYNRDGVR